MMKLLWDNLWKGPTLAAREIFRRPGNGAEILLPATGPVAVNSGNPFGTFGAWTPIVTPVNDTFMTFLLATQTTVPSGLLNMTVEFGYGAGPTALDVIREVGIIQDSPPNDQGFYPIGYNTWNTRIPAGQQLQARATQQQAGKIYEIWAMGWDGAVPTFTTFPGQFPNGAGRYYPSNISTGLGVVSAIFPNWGNWITVVDPAPQDLLVMNVSPAFTIANVVAVGIAYQVGIGPAGSEVPCATIITNHAFDSGHIWPPVWVFGGERLAIRAMSTAAGARLAVVKVLDL